MTQASFRVVAFKLEFEVCKGVYEEYSRVFIQQGISNIHFNLRTPPKINQLHFYP